MEFSIVEGARLKEEGLNLVEANNDDFCSTIRDELRALSLLEDRAVCADDARKIAARLNLTPKHPNAWGAIFRGPLWIMVGRIRSEVASNHARENRLWKAK